MDTQILNAAFTWLEQLKTSLVISFHGKFCNPDYQIKVRKDILEVIDGPMLKYGIQFLNNEKLILPRNKSN